MNKTELNKAIKTGLGKGRNLLKPLNDDILTDDILGKLRSLVFKELKQVI